MTQADKISAQQREHWNGAGGKAWVELQETMDAMFETIARRLAEAVRAEGALNVLDIGCGTGAVSLAVAGVIGPHGRCTGIDLSGPMIAHARKRAARQHIGIDFICDDAATHAFEAGRFDMLISRFGVMFFADPVAAFANLHRAAAPGARLCLYAWRSPAENDFMTAAERAAAPHLPEMPKREPNAPGQFGFADPAHVTPILERAGWRQVEMRPVDVDCEVPADALDHFLHRLGPLGQVLKDMDEPARSRLLGAVREAFDHYIHGDALRFTAACWQIEARA